MSIAEEAVVNFFLDKYIYLRQDWLKAVLNYLRQKGVDFSRTDVVCHQVYEQWLYSDIVETTEASPSDIDVSARLTTLHEPLILQLKSARDVSASFYSQVKSHTTNFVDNSCFEALTENEKEAFQKAKPQRTLTLLFTNGIQEYNAIEFKPITELTLKQKPGTKVLFLPPMKCRRGKFFLETTNFQILGGEVDSFERFSPLPPPPKKMKPAAEPHRKSFELLHDHVLVSPEKSQEKAAEPPRKSFKLLHDHVLVSPEKSQEKAAEPPRKSFKLLHDHVLVLPEKSQGKSLQAIVVATGPGARNEKGELVPLSVQVGDCVLLSENGGTKIVFEEKEHTILREQDLLAVFN